MKNIALILGFLFALHSQAARVLLLGDSQGNDGFIQKVHKTLVEKGHDVYGYGLCASGPYTWVRGYPSSGCAHNSSERRIYGNGPHWRSSLATLLAAIKPNVVVVQTGDNVFPGIAGYREFISSMKTSLIQYGVNGCAWITPTHVSKYNYDTQQKMVTITQDVMGDTCHIFASLEPTKARGFNKEHFDEGTSSTWASMALPSIFKALGE